MIEVTVFSPSDRPLKPLIEAALQHELHLLEAGIRRTEERLQAFETRYRLRTDELLHRYERHELAETLDLAEWIGEYRLLERLREKAETLREARIAD
jgi:hypothetical protein